MSERNALLIAVAFMAGLLAFMWSIDFSHGRDLGQWGETTPEMSAWYRSLKMPDNPSIPCCGESDAYFAEPFVKDGKTFARIVDDRDDEPRHRPHVPVGTVIEIPNHKLKWDSGNPVGHAVIFLGPGGTVYCFVQGTLS